MSIHDLQAELRRLGDAQTAETSQRFFKTGPGEYGEGDEFWGIRVPVLRKLARRYRELSLRDVRRLLHSAVHEQRLLALLMLVNRFARGDEGLRREIYELYLRDRRFVNNWDLVDSSAEHIVGAYLHARSKTPLHDLARSPVLWERRIAIMATFHFIKQGEFAETLRLAARLSADGEDLIHKAVGWMLREVAKRYLSVAEGFLRQHYRDMPRTMLRYAIERFPEGKRQRYLQGKA